MNSTYFSHMPGARWVMCLRIEEQSITLAANSYMDDQRHVTVILKALDLPINEQSLSRYFPLHKSHGLSPTVELLELCATKLDPTNPAHAAKFEAVASV